MIILPLLLLGTLSIIVTQAYIKDEVNKNNLTILKQASQQMDLIISELETLSFSFSKNSNMIVALKNVFNKKELTYVDHKLFTTIKSYIDSTSHIKPYVHSLYIYYDNSNNRLISSGDMGLTSLDAYYDYAWYEGYLKEKSAKGVRSELRELQRYPSSRPESILTIYNNLFTINPAEADGIIVLNIKPDYIKDLKDSTVSYPDQGLIIVNESHEPVISYKLASEINKQDISSFLNNDQNFFSYTKSENKYTVSKYVSSQYGWTYISVIPNQSLYAVPFRLLHISVTLIVVCLIMGLLLALYMTRNNYLNFLKLVKILESAQSGQLLPTDLTKVKDEHSYLIRSMIKTFLEQNYLKMQLSERKYKIKVMELLALQSQINPHFLYNTLHTISWKAIALTKKPNEVSEMIDNLSIILKYAISNSSETVPLEEELYYTQCYLNIQLVRYHNKFKVNWRCDEDILHIHVMKLLLQPLIENSIYHGIKEKEVFGTISIKIVKDHSFLKIWLVDDGLGMKPETLKAIREKLKHGEDSLTNEHIGLYNVHKRLVLMYGDEHYGIRIKSKYNKGTAIYMRIPIPVTTMLLP
ncbi:sensor histidine kinase [Paenibacillus abyssi]|uniref:sensor histidine kinase n=1 Tax=Paenibacillus abyssi TaxID=1340531 RepID=UPI00361A91C3